MISLRNFFFAAAAAAVITGNGGDGGACTSSSSVLVSATVGREDKDDRVTIIDLSKDIQRSYSYNNSTGWDRVLTLFETKSFVRNAQILQHGYGMNAPDCFVGRLFLASLLPVSYLYIRFFSSSTYRYVAK